MVIYIGIWYIAVGKPGIWVYLHISLGKLNFAISFKIRAKNTIFYNIMVVLLIGYFSVKVMTPGRDEWIRANPLVMVANRFCL